MFRPLLTTDCSCKSFTNTWEIENLYNQSHLFDRGPANLYKPITQCTFANTVLATLIVKYKNGQWSRGFKRQRWWLCMVWKFTWLIQRLLSVRHCGFNYWPPCFKYLQISAFVGSCEAEVAQRLEYRAISDMVLGSPPLDPWAMPLILTTPQASHQWMPTALGTCAHYHCVCDSDRSHSICAQHNCG